MCRVIVPRLDCQTLKGKEENDIAKIRDIDTRAQDNIWTSVEWWDDR